MKKISRRLRTHFKKYFWVWVGLTVFFVLAWLWTGSGCTFHALIGLPCPGCGLTRAVVTAFQGDWQKAFQLHPLFWLAPLVFAAVLIGLTTAPEKLSSDRMNRVWLAIAILFVAVYVIRMFLFFPDREPMVFNENALMPRIWQTIRHLID